MGLTACALSVFASQIHLSQRERQEHCRELSHCTYYFSDTPYGLAPPSGELARECLRGFLLTSLRICIIMLQK